MLYVNMAIGASHGWGICGRHIVRELSYLEDVKLVGEPIDAAAAADAIEARELQNLLLREDELVSKRTDSGILISDGPLLQGIADERLLPRDKSVRARINIGYTFFERNILSKSAVRNGTSFFNKIVAGSTWCADILEEAGLRDVETVIQGVDPTVFRPNLPAGGRHEFLKDKFVVFSGGKFEFRKGHDIVIRAYKVLQDRHADVMLINAWFNLWPAYVETMRASKLIRFMPNGGSHVDMVNKVLSDNGLDLDRVISCPRQLNTIMARIYQNTDVGLFPNRCEGGTNLVLMEYMACGKPSIAANTTGHADIVRNNNAILIESYGQVSIHDDSGKPVASWPEPDLDDVIDKLEWAYQHRDSLHVLAEQAGRDLAALTWRRAAERLANIIHRCVTTY